jgi:hypothetical protein
MCVLFLNYRQVQSKKNEIKKFNLEYEYYNTKEDLCGVDITTVINKAVNNNEKYEVQKDENGYYISNDENSVKIYITLINTSKTYEMERIKEIGLESFVAFFGEVKFKCTDMKYHSNGKISEMTFESLEE